MRLDDKLLFIVLYTILVACLWIAGTTTIFRFVNPKATQTEATLHIPRSIMLDFTWGGE